MSKNKSTSISSLYSMIKEIDKKNTQYNLFDSLDNKKSEIEKLVKDSVAVKDEYGNSLTATGTKDKVASFTNYGFDNNTLNWWLWLALYNDSWVFKRAIDKPSQDCVRCGVTLNGDEDKTKIYDDLKKYQFDLIQILEWGALFGGSIGVLMFDNILDEEYRNPLNINKVKQSKAMRIYVTDRWFGVAQYGTELVTNMTNIDFGKPKYYEITFADGKTLIVHHDYILRYEHRIAPKLVKTGQLQGWGYAEGAHILNELSRDDQLKSSIQSLVNKSLIEVIKMSGMRGVFMGADSDNEEQLRKRLEMVNWGRTFNSLTFLDKDDEYSQNQFSGLNGLSDLLEKNMWLISAALEMQGVLYGDLKQGFSNDTDALERYDETIQNRCESYYRPVIEKLISILYIKYNINETVDFTFNSLLMKKQNEARLNNLKDYTSILSQLLGDGIITPQLYAKSLQKYSSKAIIDFGLTEDEINKLDENISNEFENIDLDTVDLKEKQGLK